MKEYETDQIGDNHFILRKEFTQNPIVGVCPVYNKEVSIKSSDEVWVLGLDKNPLDPSDTTVMQPAPTARHLLMLITLLTEMSAEELHDKRRDAYKVSTSLNNLCIKMYGYTNEKVYIHARKMINELKNCWTSRKLPDGRVKYFQLIEAVSFTSLAPRRKRKAGMEDTMELFFDYVTINKSFVHMLHEYEKINRLSLDNFTPFKNDLALSIYFYIPSRAVFHDEKHPWKISLTKLMEENECVVPAYKSKRKNMMVGRNNTGPMSELNGATLQNGDVINCRLELSKDKKDFNFVVWVKKKTGKSIDSRVKSTYQKYFEEQKFDWDKLVSGARDKSWDNREEHDLCKWLEKANEGTKWGFKLFNVALGDAVFFDICAAESDGEAGVGAMINKFKQILESNK